jgi:pimeloyl-ACP methyl ester carboxylesterase
MTITNTRPVLARVSTIVRATALLALALLALPVAAGNAAESQGPLQVPALKWQSCGKIHSAARCATAKVPLDYDNPAGATTRIALAKIPASRSRKKLGTVFVNPGGPGISGVDFVLTGFGDHLAARLGGRFDVVGFDPRGVARSEGIRCFADNDELYQFFNAVAIFPYARIQEWTYFEHYRSLAADCFHPPQRITMHMSTADVARDLDLLRRAVGDKKLTYLGLSYGTYIGNTYANLFPQNVRALALDGVLDPRRWARGTQIKSDRVATAKELAEFLRLCDKARSKCPLSVKGGAAARYEALAAWLHRQPLIFWDGFVYKYDTLISDTIAAMYSPDTWGGADGFGAYFGLLADIVLGDPAAAQRGPALRAALRERLGQGRHEPYDNQFEAYSGNNCADAQFPYSFADFREVAKHAEQGSIFGPAWWWPNATCALWPVSPDRFTGPWTTRTANPVLVVGNLYDGITDYRGAVVTRTLLKNSRLLTYAGWGHTAYFNSKCAAQHIVAYLRDGKLPPAGTVCPAAPNPFLAARPAADAARALMTAPAPTPSATSLVPSWIMR